MFREISHKKKQLSQAQCADILHKGTSGVLAVAGDDGYPYAVPLSYVYQEGHIYFHSAPQGHKLDALDRCEKVSFCVVGQDEVCPEKFTTLYRSVIVFGRAKVLEGAEKRRALELLSDKYCPVDVCVRDAEIDPALDRVRLVDIQVEHLTGKQSIYLVNE